jgi:hypothetical protein
VAGTFGGEAGGAAQALLQAGQAVPRLLGTGDPRRVLAQRLVEPGLLLAYGRQLPLERRAAVLQRGLVGEFLRELALELHEVVGEQAQPGVTDIGLDHGGLARGLGLLAERLELAADLGQEVLQAGDVALGGGELAERLLLALAVLEDARGLLDVAAAFFRCRAQDAIELALPDDHVHLTTDAGVGEQLLDVEQPAGLAVDGVLGAAVAEHDPADRDFGVVDRQGAVGVVDREHDLRPAERRPPGRTGEDHVLHLAAAQTLRALLAHHPGDGVDDVRLPRAVGAHHTGDPGLQMQRRRRCERFESAERQAFEIQRATLLVQMRPAASGGVPPLSRRRGLGLFFTAGMLPPSTPTEMSVIEAFSEYMTAGQITRGRASSDHTG